MGSLALIVVVVAVVIGVVGFLVVRARQPAPPRNANEGQPDSMWDNDGAVAKEPGGMPMQRSSEDAPSHSDAIARQAEREAERGGPGV